MSLCSILLGPGSTSVVEAVKGSPVLVNEPMDLIMSWKGQ